MTDKATPLISPELMEETWQAVAQMEAHELQRLQALAGEEQEALTGFVFAATTTDLGPDAAGIALYAHAVVMEAFRRTGKQFRTVTTDAIARAWEDDGPPLEPAAMQYVLDALTEVDEDDPVDIDDDELRHALRVLETVLDCMHEAHHTG